MQKVSVLKAGCPKERFDGLVSMFKEYFGAEPTRFFSAPGRTEICGNHTDHNHGKVVAAAVNLDVIAAVLPTDDGIVSVKSEGYPEDRVELSNLSVVEAEKNGSAALIRGVLAGFENRGLKVGGFKAFTRSNVLKGSGLSSSAAFEVLIGTILSGLYNGGAVSAEDIAVIAQYAENEYFGKPSGLMDQMASSVGGFTKIDFKDPAAPVIEAVPFDLSSYDHSLCIIDTKGSHADLTPDYAAIPEEMKAVAGVFGKPCLRELTREEIVENIPALREKAGDRAVLRALHFFDENERVDELAEALKAGDFGGFLSVINRSGESSYKYLQNVYSSAHPGEQGVSLAIYLAKSILKGEGAARVHGGGFAGTVQAFVPNKSLKSFVEGIEKVFGEGSCHVLNIRPFGGIEVEP